MISCRSQAWKRRPGVRTDYIRVRTDLFILTYVHSNTYLPAVITAQQQSTGLSLILPPCFGFEIYSLFVLISSPRIQKINNYRTPGIIWGNYWKKNWKTGGIMGVWAMRFSRVPAASVLCSTPATSHRLQRKTTAKPQQRPPMLNKPSIILVYSASNPVAAALQPWKETEKTGTYATNSEPIPTPKHTPMKPQPETQSLDPRMAIAPNSPLVLINVSRCWLIRTLPRLL